MDQRVQVTPVADRSARYLSGIALALAGAFLYSWKPIFIKLLFAEGVDAETQLALRMGLALPFYVVMAIAAYLGRKATGTPTDLSRRTLISTMGIGVLGYYFASYLDILGLERISAQFERLILYTYPGFVALIGFLIYRQQLTRSHLKALVLTYLGLAVIFVQDLHSFGPQVVSGTLLVLGCSIAFAFYLLLSKRPIADMGSRLFTCISMFAGTALLLLQFALTHPIGLLLVSGRVLWLSIGIALVSTVIPSFLMAEAIARLGPGPASVTGGAGPIITSLLAIWLLGEPFTPWHLAGMALVIGGVVVLSRDKG